MHVVTAPTVLGDVKDNVLESRLERSRCSSTSGNRSWRCDAREKAGGFIPTMTTLKPKVTVNTIRLSECGCSYR